METDEKAAWLAAAEQIDEMLRMLPARFGPHRPRQRRAEKAIQLAGMANFFTKGRLRQWLNRLSHRTPGSLARYWAPKQRDPALITRLRDRLTELLRAKEATAISCILRKSSADERHDLVSAAILASPDIVELAKTHEGLACWISAAQNGRLTDIRSVKPELTWQQLRLLKQALDAARNRQKRAARHRNEAPLDDSILRQIRGTDEESSEKAGKDEEIELLKEAIRQLRLLDQKMLWMHWREGLRLAEIGRRVGLSKNRVSERISAALKRVYRYMVAKGVEPVSASREATTRECRRRNGRRTKAKAKEAEDLGPDAVAQSAEASQRERALSRATKRGAPSGRPQRLPLGEPP